MSSEIVTSRYFTVQPGMDESLHFQEKKTVKGPRTIEKPKLKRSSKPKKIKGQKDIRSVLKKNELITYSKDFNKVCKDSGIDVDPEQLQLAIALSKSLQQTESNADTPSTSRGNSLERSGKIRTTLQEYGFKVPEIKPKPKNKKLKAPKNCKLLLATDAEKEKTINDRFAQILATYVDRPHLAANSSNTANLYYIATNIPYEVIKDDNAYYVEGLFEKLPNTVGSLLKDWKSIPGRPVTPLVEESTVNFSNIECSQEELDSVLSGCIQFVQDFVANKHSNCVVDEDKDFKDNNTKSSEETNKMDTDIIEIDCGDNKTTKLATTNINSNDSVIEIIEPGTMTLDKNRSLSPDLFDDEVSCIMDKSDHCTQINIEELKTTNTNIFMDLTTCVNVKAVNVTALGNKTVLSQLSQGTNVTKRKSNDLMEITNCISQPLVVNHTDLTNNLVKDSVIKKLGVINEDNVHMDLTQSSSSDDSLPFVQISGKDEVLDNIIIPDDNNINTEDISLREKQQNTNNTNDIIVNEEDKHSQLDSSRANQVNDTNSQQDECNPTVDGIDNNSHVFFYKEKLSSEMKDSGIRNRSDSLLSENSRTEESSEKCDMITKSQSFFEEFNHSHSEDELKEKEAISLDNNSVEIDNKEINDLTQSSESSAEITEEIAEQSTGISSKVDSLGKIGEVSIDYDEMFDQMAKEHSTNSKQSPSNDNTVSFDVYDKSANGEVDTESNITNDINSSQASEVFEISDNELGYSMQKSRIYENNSYENLSQNYEDINTAPTANNFEIGGLSIMDNLSSLRNSKSNSFDKNGIGTSFLPEVNINSTDSRKRSISPIKPDDTPLKIPIGNPKSVNTPKNNDFIVKTEQVTPMADYEALNTPERNKELEKYGLKPFKRKRAIQLLKHLYNQTHPFVESCEDLPSTSKKLKPSESPKSIPQDEQNKKSANGKGERKNCIESGSEKDNIYEITTEVPDIRNLDCGEEDWVFQKREKAKIHSCRVPLHISFHNYISTRGFLRAAILRYEPVNIETVHRGLVENGCRYDPKDLLKFMDKKCITVKTADNNSRNKKHY